MPYIIVMRKSPSCVLNNLLQSGQHGREITIDQANDDIVRTSGSQAVEFDTVK